ncbi:hypothetical protein [Micromonospora sp. NPDC049102]|uniref:hypothetical protein n=1 Tax=Micromonospora sp. NPDC049102 TaxID=3364265 RepID=UPI0037109BC5
MLENWPEVKDAFPAEVRAAHVRQFSDQATVHAICEEFRAAATLDYDQDQADRGSRKIACPLLFLWSQHGQVGVSATGTPRYRRSRVDQGEPGPGQGLRDD